MQSSVAVLVLRLNLVKQLHCLCNPPPARAAKFLNPFSTRATNVKVCAKGPTNFSLQVCQATSDGATSLEIFVCFCFPAYNDQDAVPLPLGQDFQNFVEIFIDTDLEDKYSKASNIIEQLQ